MRRPRRAPSSSGPSHVLSFPRAIMIGLVAGAAARSSRVVVARSAPVPPGFQCGLRRSLRARARRTGRLALSSSSSGPADEDVERRRRGAKDPPEDAASRGRRPGPSAASPPGPDELPLLLDPRAPLRPLLADDHLRRYALPPLEMGIDDYRPNLRKGQRIVAFGDVHGDIDALREFLIAAEVLDPGEDDESSGANGDGGVDGANGSNGANAADDGSSSESWQDAPVWCGGDTICVQTGDVLDRGDDELACFRLLADLSRQARRAGGALLLLHGNHEALNAAGLFQYANPGGNLEFELTVGRRIDYNYGSNRWRLQFAGNEPPRWASFEPRGFLSETMLGNMLVACVVGRTVFVHAGLTADHLREGNGEDDEGRKKYGGVSRLNHQAREWILKAHHGDNNNWGEYETVQEVIAAAQNRAKVASKAMSDCLGGGIGASLPVWMRDYSQPADREPKNRQAGKMIAEALEESGPDVRRMVMGHTPQRQINSALGGRAWRINVGASKGVMGGTPEVLEILHMAGEDDEDVINILTKDGGRISAKERSVATDDAILDFFDLKR
ncbi:hypothetical protein ACHAWF_008426 [Thalassiosira exigua]